jgi:putative membrane protein
MSRYPSLIICSLTGTLLASLLACIPALHVYNIAGLLLLVLSRTGMDVPPQHVAMFMLGMVVGYAIVNTIPSLFLAAPDESAAWIVLPGQKYLMQRRGYEAAALTCIGSMGSVLVLGLLTPFIASVVSPLLDVVQPHLHWLLGAITLYMLASEWPKSTGRGETALKRLWDGWRSISAGIATFALSGLLGIVLAYRPLTPLHASYQGLMPAFVGLFAVPWALQNLLSRTSIPEQYVCKSLDVTPWLILRGVAAGTVGGLLAAFLPMVTGGIGGLIAGHATAQRDERLFIVSQGASKAVYYIAGLLLSFVPGLHLVRGGMASMLSPIYVPHTPEEYWLSVAAMVLCCAFASALLLWLSRLAIALISHISYRWVSWGTLALLVVLVGGLTGWGGLLTMSVAAGIGLIPVLFHSRRMNCMGVLLVPTLLNMAGLGPLVANWLDLV